MIAEVYPITRTPRRMAVLDYEIPEGMPVKRGDLVDIPFRQSRLFGIVKSVKTEPIKNVRLKPIRSIHVGDGLSENELSLLEQLADQSFTQINTLLLAQIPTPLRRISKPKSPSVTTATPLTIPTSEAGSITWMVGQMNALGGGFFQASDLKRTAALILGYLTKKPDHLAMIVCPHVRDAQLLAQTLQGSVDWLLTGEETKGERWRIWHSLRQAKKGLFLTTRAGMLYAPDQLTSVFVLRSSHPDHVQKERAPRLDTRLVMAQRAESCHALLFFFDAYPRPEDLQTFGASRLLFSASHIEAHPIHTSQERQISSHPVLLTTTQAVIQQTLAQNERVVLVYHQKGFARRFFCETCKAISTCPTCQHILRVNRDQLACFGCKEFYPLPRRCSACGSDQVHSRGFGIERLADDLGQLFPGIQTQVIDQDHLDPPQAQILLVTRAFLDLVFNPFQKFSAGCVIHLDPDTPLFSADFRASGRAIWSASEWRGVAHALRATFYLQSDEFEWFTSQWLQPQQTLAQTLALRQAYHQPPFHYWLKVRLKEQETQKRNWDMQTLIQQLQLITGVRVLIEPSTQLHEAHLRLQSTPAAWSVLQPLLKTLDERFVVDTNVFSG